MITNTHELDTLTLPLLFVADADEEEQDIHEPAFDDSDTEDEEEGFDPKFIKDEEKFIDGSFPEEEELSDETESDDPFEGADEYGDGRDM